MINITISVTAAYEAWQRNTLNFVPHIRDGIELMTGDKILSGKIKNVCVNVR